MNGGRMAENKDDFGKKCELTRDIDQLKKKLRKKILSREEVHQNIYRGSFRRCRACMVCACPKTKNEKLERASCELFTKNVCQLRQCCVTA